MEGLRHVAAGQSPQVERIADIDAWNQAHYEARRDQPWDDVWKDLHAARQALLDILREMSQASLAQFFLFPWGPEGTGYHWVCVYLEHARDLRW